MDNLNTTVEIVGVQNQIDISTSKLFLPTNSNLAFPKLSQKCPHRYKKRKRKKKFHKSDTQCQLPGRIYTKCEAVRA